MPVVLYLNPYGTLGGAERSLLELLSALDRKRYQPLFVLGSSGPLVAQLRGLGVEVLVEPFPAPPLHRLILPGIFIRELRASMRLLRLIRRRGVGMIHCGDVLSLLLLLPSALLGARIVYQLNYLGGLPRRLLLNALALASVDVIVAVSAHQARVLRRQTLLLGGRTITVHPGIGWEESGPATGSAFRRELGLAEAVPLVGLVGRYDEWKGHVVFLEAAARVLERRPDARFVMVGGALNQESLPHVSRYRSGVMERRSALGLEQTVSVVDHRHDMAVVLAALDVVVCPSDHEPFGMVVIEAMAAGRPVVVADSGGPAEIVQDGRNGLLFPTGDAAALADRILRLLEDDNLRRALAAEGSRRVQQAFHRDRYARDIQAVYDRLA